MSSDTCGCYQWTWNNLQITVVMFTSKANISSFPYITAEQIILVSPFEPFPFKSVSPVLSLVVQCRSAGFINMWESDISVYASDNSSQAKECGPINISAHIEVIFKVILGITSELGDL